MNRHELKRQWLTVALDRAGIDAKSWIPSLGVAANRSTIEAVYSYYRNLYIRDRRFEWAGMANLMGASFYGGFLDIAAAPARLLRFYETTFLRMQKKIFEDQAVMHEAYRAVGVEGVEQLAGAAMLDGATVRAWRLIDGSDEAGWREGNRWLLYREQDDILDYFYGTMSARHVFEGAVLTYLMTLAGVPSVVGARSYPAVLPLTLVAGRVSLRTPLADGSIAVFPDRWELIELDTLPAYLRLLADPSLAYTEMCVPLATRVEAFRLRSYWMSTLSRIMTSWGIQVGSRDGVETRRAMADSRPGRGGGVTVDLGSRQAVGAPVRAWANPRNKPFQIEANLPGGMRYAGRARLVKLYPPVRVSSPTRLTVKLPPAQLKATEQTLRQLAQQWRFDEAALDTWVAEVGRSAALGHHYSTRIFDAEPFQGLRVEFQLEHHIKEDEFIVDVLFAIEQPD